MEEMSKLEEQGNQGEPSLEELGHGVGSPFWGELHSFLRESYGVSPTVEYSGCSLAPGWNVKYRARGRALCTIYPDTGTFTCMISIGQKEAPAMELVLPGLTAYVREVYQNSRPSRMGRWLMIRVSGPEILEDVKTLLRIRMRSGERETKAENIRLAGKGRERCAGGKEEKEGQSSVFFLHPDEIRHELPGHRVSGADSAEHLPGAGSQDLLFGSKRDSLKSQAAVMASA